MDAERNVEAPTRRSADPGDGSSTPARTDIGAKIGTQTRCRACTIRRPAHGPPSYEPDYSDPPTSANDFGPDLNDTAAGDTKLLSSA